MRIKRKKVIKENVYVVICVWFHLETEAVQLQLLIIILFTFSVVFSSSFILFFSLRGSDGAFAFCDRCFYFYEINFKKMYVVIAIDLKRTRSEEHLLSTRSHLSRSVLRVRSFHLSNLAAPRHESDQKNIFQIE